MSPLLFALFLSDLELFLKSKGLRGVSVSHLSEILLLAFADDIVILADSYIAMKNVTKYLFEYCVINKLIVNVKKTKIILFQKGGHGHKKKLAPFFFGIDLIEYVNEYKYLGVTMTQTALFEQATKQYIIKSKAACTSTISLIFSLNIDTRNVYNKLFDSLVISVLLYAAPVYAIRYLNEIEKVQMFFFKRILNLSYCTPNYAVRLETGRSHLGVLVFKQTLNWLIKIMAMSDERTPKICLLKQISLMSLDSKLCKYNWALQICQTFFQPIGKASMWDNLTLASLLSQKKSLINAYKNFTYNKDTADYFKSNSLLIYTDLRLKTGQQYYFRLRLKIKFYRFIAQIRLMNNITNKLCIDQDIYKFNDDTTCHLCNKNNSFFHMLIECNHFHDKRLQSKLPLTENFNLNLFNILEEPNSKLISNLYSLTKHILYTYNLNN